MLLYTEKQDTLWLYLQSVILNYFKEVYTSISIFCKDRHNRGADPGISKRGGGGGGAGGGGPGAVEFLGLGFVLMPLHTYSMCL